MKKFIVAVVIIGAFVLYSFVYHANSVALVPGTSTKSGVSTSAPTTGTTSTTSGATNMPSSSTTPTSGGATNTPGALYKDGSYTGSQADAQWGYIQVKATIQNGKLTNVQFLQSPSDRNRSIEINNYADPQLASEAIQAQSANVDVVTGATDSSDAFIQSLSDALSQAKA